MEQQGIIKELKNYFDIRELVCKHVYDKFEDASWQFFDRDFLETLLVVRRDILKTSMLVNNWHIGGTYTQRGLRCNICDLVKSQTLKNNLYMTSHANGAAIDFDAKGMTVAQVHAKIKFQQNLLPCRVRMEADVAWNHLDIYDSIHTLEKFSEFKG